MDAIVANVLKREAVNARADQSLSIVIIFSGIGLLASLCAMAMDIDVAGRFL